MARKPKINIPIGVTIAVVLSIGILIALNGYLHIPFLPSLDDFSTVSSTIDADEGIGIETKVIGDCEVHYIDVGQGDSILITCDNSNILIDGGDVDKDKVVVDYIKSLGITKLDMVVASHAHADHIGGLDSVINEFDIGMVLMSKLTEKTTPTTRVYNRLLTAISDKGLKITVASPGREYCFGKGTFTVLGPLEQYNDLNNTSVVLKFEYDNILSFLFTGDMEENAEKDLVANGSNLDTDVLKLGHHGSNTATSEELYNAVSPSYCIIQCGEGNKYGHPHKETLKLLEDKQCANVYRNDINGTIVFRINDSKVSVMLERKG